MRIGILHPGAMGADLGRVLSACHDVLWLGNGRSAETRARAITAGLVEAGTFVDLVAQSDVIISICPPSAAMKVAQEVALIRSDGFLYVDANTIAPGTVRDVAGLFGKDVVVDAALTGAPGAENLTIWVSGIRKSEACGLFENTRVAYRPMGDDIGQACAFKICSGLRSKVIPAIWATLIEATTAAGPEVEHAVRTHLTDIGYDLDREAQRIAERAPKAQRWVGEMEESAKAMRELGLPAGFSEAAAAAYARIAGWLYAGRPVSCCYVIDVPCECEVSLSQAVTRVMSRGPERDSLPSDLHVGMVAYFSRLRRYVHRQVHALVVSVGEGAGDLVPVARPTGQCG